jgi:hypothetical protein
VPRATDDGAVQADTYIDALLAAHRHALVPLTVEADAVTPLETQPAVREVIHLLERGLPRFHPSFLFEEWLAEQLRGTASLRARAVDGAGRFSDVIPIAVIKRADGERERLPAWALRDRRLLVGGAIASGVSIAGAAVIAWRRNRN